MEKSEVILYVADITKADTEELFKKYGTYFEHERLMRIIKCQNPVEKGRIISTGVLLQHVFSSYGYQLSDICYGEYGKPFVANNDAFFFNISHSGAYVCIAVSGQPIGIDIQKPVSPKKEVIDKICSKEEKEEFENSGKHFNYLWAVKEASAKLIGEGIRHDFKKISFDIKEISPEIFLDNEHLGYAVSERIEDNYSLVVVCKGEFKITQHNKYVL